MKRIAIVLILLTLLLLLSLTREMLFEVIMTFVKHDASAISITAGYGNSSISEPYSSSKTNHRVSIIHYEAKPTGNM